MWAVFNIIIDGVGFCERCPSADDGSAASYLSCCGPALIAARALGGRGDDGLTPLFFCGPQGSGVGRSGEDRSLAGRHGREVPG